MSSLDFSIELRRTDAQHAALLWDQSAQTSVFTHPEVLGRLAHSVHWWIAEIRGEPACVWPICLNREGQVRNPELAYFLGPFDLTPPEPSPRRRLLRKLALQSAFLKRFSREYGSLCWSTLPGQHDVRPWTWSELPGAQILARPRYTAEIDGLQSTSAANLIQRFSYERRADARRALRQGARRLSDASLSVVQELYLEGMASQGRSELAERRLEEVAAVHELTGSRHGFRVVCTQGDADRVRSVWLVLLAKGRACGVIAVADAAWRHAQYNAYTCLQALLDAQARGADCDDFNGANSPQRGPDKHSDGAEGALYFDLEMWTSESE